MAEGQDECREAFEKWAKEVNPLEHRRLLDRQPSEIYTNSTTTLLWTAWQAAWNTRTESGLVKELVEALQFYAGADDEDHKAWSRRMQNDMGEKAIKALAKHKSPGQHAEQPVADQQREIRLLTPEGIEESLSKNSHYLHEPLTGNERKLLRDTLALLHPYLRTTEPVTPSATDLAKFTAKIARMTQDGEEVGGKEFVMENDDAVTTLNELIGEARGLAEADMSDQPDEQSGIDMRAVKAARRAFHEWKGKEVVQNEDRLFHAIKAYDAARAALANAKPPAAKPPAEAV